MTSGPPASNPGKAVLLVDDEPLFTESVADAMRERFPMLRVHEARDGLEALEMLEKLKIHAMVADLRMPRMSGFELLEALAERGDYIPTILVTAHGSVEIAAKSQRQGVVAYLEKPVDLATLIDVVDWTVRQPEANHIAGVTLNGFLQLLAMERATCTVRVVGPRGHGVLGFSDGALESASWGHITGDDAVLGIATWRDYSIYLESVPLDAEPNVQSPVIELLLEAARLSDEGIEGPTPSLPPSHNLREEDIVFPTVSSVPSIETVEDAPPRPPESSTSQRSSRRETTMSNVNEILEEAMGIEGAFAVALVDYESGMTLGTRCNSNAFDIEVAASGNTQVVRSKMSVMNNLKISGGIEDMLITLDTQYHLIRPLHDLGNLFLYLAIDRKKGNLGMARHQLTSLQGKLSI